MKGRLDAVPIPAVRSLRTLPGGHPGKHAQSAGAPGCCQVKHSLGRGTAGEGNWAYLSPHLQPRPPQPVSALRLAQMGGTCSILSQISSKLLTTAPALHPSIYLSPYTPRPQLGPACTFSHSRSERMEGRGQRWLCLPLHPPLGWGGARVTKVVGSQPGGTA